MSAQDLYAVAGLLYSQYHQIAKLIIFQDFCLIPIGTANSSVAEEIAQCQRILAASGLKYKVRVFLFLLLLLV